MAVGPLTYIGRLVLLGHRNPNDKIGRKCRSIGEVEEFMQNVLEGNLLKTVTRKTQKMK
jgi:hypothetical protein